MLVKMFNTRARGFAVVLNYPFENTVEVLDPNGDVQFTNANYLMPAKEWMSVIWSDTKTAACILSSQEDGAG